MHLCAVAAQRYLMIQVMHHHEYSLLVPTKVTRERTTRDDTLHRASIYREKKTPPECLLMCQIAKKKKKLEEVVETCHGILNVTSALL